MTKVLIIGLDGGTFDVIAPLVKKGEMPNVKKLLEVGASGEMESTTPIITPAAWSAMVTGKNPGKTGIFDFDMQERDSYESRIAYERVPTRLDIWDILTKSDKRSIVVSVPVTYPPKQINGIMISGMLTPPDKTDYIYPPDVGVEIRKLAKKSIYGWRELAPNQFMKKLHEKTERKKKLMETLLTKNDWDFAMVVFRATDIAGHNLWKYHEKNSPEYGSSPDYIEQTYKMMDEVVGGLLSIVPDDTHIAIVSDHGMGSLHRIFYLNTWLEREGYLLFKKQKKKRFYREDISRLMVKLHLTSLLKVIPERFKNRVKRRGFIGQIDMAKTRAYTYGRTSVGVLYINTTNKPMGIVSPERYNPLRDEIIAKLRRLQDGGNKVVSEAYKREELYSGGYVEDAPDIIFNSDYRIRSQHNANVFGDSQGLSGDHTKEGIFIIAGPYVKHTKVKGIQIIDVTPTVLAAMGVPIPSDVDGKVLDVFKKRPDVKYKDYKSAKAGENISLSASDEEKVRKKLKELGYF